MIHFTKKTIFKAVISFITAAVLILCPLSVKPAFAASASLSGPSSVRAGDSITLTLNISASGSYGLEGTLSYDSSFLTLTDINISASGWKLETNGNKIVAYDDALSSPLSGSVQLITASFKVSSSVSEGTVISVSFDGLTATDGTNESNLGNAGYSTSILAPLSGNTNLSSLSIDGISLAPSFNSNTTVYDGGEIDYSVSSLNITAVCEDAKSSVSINGNSLSVGANTVSITVKAENGTTKTYSVNVSRKQDPNYVPSSDASLSSITLSTGVLTPAFSPEITEYAVYLPFETPSISVSGTAADTKSQGVTGSELNSLSVGDNVLTVICTAEDGTTKQYTIHTVLMPEYKGILPNIEGIEPESTEEATEELTTEEETSEETTSATEDNSQKTSSSSTHIIPIIISAFAAAAIGFGVCFILWYKGVIKKKN